MKPLCLDAALGYSQRGWRVLALTPDGKTPISDKKLQPHGSRSATTDPKHIAELFHLYPEANVGIATGKESGITVVDLDGKEAVAELKKVGLTPPNTYTVKTPRGYHLYITYDERIKQTANLVPKCDVRNDGGYVVAPPSQVNGTVYKLAKAAEILSWPEQAAFAEKPRATPEKTEDRPNWVSDLLTNGAKFPGRNDAAIRLAGYYRSRGIPRDIATASLLQFAERCEPPFERKELEETIASAWRYQPSTIPAYRGMTIEPPQVDKSITGRLRFMWPEQGVFAHADRVKERREGLTCWLTLSIAGMGEIYGPTSQNVLSARFEDSLVKRLAERHEANWPGILQHIRAETVKSLEETGEAVDMVTFKPSVPSLWIAHPFVRRMQPNVIFGHGGGGKTTLGAALCISIASGVSILPGVDIRERGNVLYLDWETDDEEFATVRDALLAHAPEAASQLQERAIVYRRCAGPLEGQIDRVIRDVVDHDVTTVFYDSLAKAVASNINEPEAPRVFYQCIGATEASSVVFTHISAESVIKRGSEIRPFGSVYWWDYGRNNWFLKASQEPGEKTMRIGLYHSKINRGRKLKPYGYEMHFDEDEEQNTIGIHYATADIREDELLAEGASVIDRICFVLRSGDKASEQIAEMVGHPHEKTHRLLRKYKDKLLTHTPYSNTWGLKAREDVPPVAHW